MKKISLLPPEIKEKRLAKRRQSRLLLILLIVLIVLVSANAFLMADSFLVRSNLNSVISERELVESQVGDLGEYEQLYRELNRIEQLFGAVVGEEPLWGMLLSSIGQNIPLGTQLADLRVSYVNQSGSLSMTGSTSSHDSLASLLEQIEGMEELDRVQCRVSAETTLDGRSAVQFQIESLLLGGPGVFPREEEGEEGGP